MWQPTNLSAQGRKKYRCYKKLFLLLTELRILHSSIPTETKNVHQLERRVNSNIHLELPRWGLFLLVARNQNNTIYKTEHSPLYLLPTFSIFYFGPLLIYNYSPLWNWEIIAGGYIAQRMNSFLNKANWKKYKPQREKCLPISWGTLRSLQLAPFVIVSMALLPDISRFSTMSLVRIA